MINPFHDVNWKPDLAERRKFGRSLVIGFPCLGLVLLLIGWAKTGHFLANEKSALWLAGVGAGAGVIFWAVPLIAKPFYLVWYFWACCIGIVMGNLLLGAFYFLVITPFGLVKRAARPKAFLKTFDKSANTYWQDVEPARDLGRYYKQF